jgi:hypothetical protein
MYACTAVSKCSRSWAAHGNTYSILGLDEWVIDSNDMNIIMLDGISIDDTPDSSETVDSDVGRHSEVIRLFSLQSCRLEVRPRGTLRFS